MRIPVKRQMNSLRRGLERNLKAWIIQLVNHHINSKTSTRRTYLLLPSPLPLAPHAWNVIRPLLIVFHERRKVLFVLLHEINNVLSHFPMVLRSSPQLVSQGTKKAVPIRRHNGDACTQLGDLLLETLLLVLPEAFAFSLLLF